MCKFIKLFNLFFFLLLTALLPGCSSNDYKADTPIDAININLKACSDKDFDLVLQTLDDGSPSFAISKIMYKNLFDKYDLKYELADAQVLENDGTTAKVQCLQTTTLIGPSFRNNKTTMIHTLKYKNGAWRLCTSEVKNVEYLN